MNPRLTTALLVATLATVLLGLTACPGTLDNRDEFRRQDDAGSDGAVQDMNSGDVGAPCTPATIQTEILIPSCSNDLACHGDANAGSLNLKDPNVEARVFGVTSSCMDLPIATAGDGASYLMEKLTSDAPTCGVRMPLSSTLTQAELDCVTAWINAQ